MLCMPHPLQPRTPSLLSLSSIPELRFPPQLFTPPLSPLTSPPLPSRPWLLNYTAPRCSEPHF